MQIKQLTVGAIEANCWVLWGDSREALVVDPGSDPESILAWLGRKQLSVVAYLLTHGHFDHIGALVEVHRTHPAPVALHPADARWAFTERNQMPPYYPAVLNPPPITRDLADGQTWTDGGLAYRVITTPGHSPGGVCFLFEEEQVLISGDTLFRGSIGRTDLPGSDGQAMERSLDRLKALPDALKVCPGHGPATTLGAEKQHNPFL